MMCWLGNDRVKAEMSPEGHGDEADTGVMDEGKEWLREGKHRKCEDLRRNDR